ncbi:hypothetical protein CDA63_06870 [Hymenobacter amundsenii]|uniref:Lipocalin-like domain-containing protein n=1 Tax=Hymenobacter amundsenii TaxID=2006685 RepID=A0A246FMM4_9BACT|nr:hypothetical protein [Hymenobacter amundsenii]OWP63929.1 hypothetical protein CDA63_06870 [Hymenobacter amundsenii]
MRTFLLTMLATGVMALNACTTKVTEAPAEKREGGQVLDSQLQGRLWINSYEAQPNKTPTYRPEGYTWATPPQRFSMPIEGGDGFRLDADGKGVYIAPGIGAGPTTHPVTWQRDDPNRPIFRLHVTDNSRPDLRLEIVSVTPDLLTARYLP